jgi:endo-1,4-beta-D-glucanase Y/subtilisin-like proprotein convertase family protein
MKKLLAYGMLLATLITCKAADYPTTTTGNYTNYYTQYKAGAFWVNVSKMGNTTVSNGLGIWDGKGTGGAGIVSESMGYAMILSALYNDKVTFDKLSATIQAGFPYGKSNGTSTGLFPWSWVSSGSNTTFIASNTLSENVYDSASDGDINIALGYIYADQAKTVYGWSDPAGSSYATMAKNYIAAIRQKDFTSASGQSDANKHILCGGADLAISGWPSGGQVWHPDYSDIRAYQLFSKYDVSYASFWSSAITYTKASWKAILDFGSTDTRSTWTVQPPTTGDIGAASSNVWISNPTYGMSTFSANYTQVKGTRYYYTYEADACRMPMRIMNYVNASENSDAQMTGIASAILSALGSSYKTSGYTSLYSSLNIWTPFTQGGSYIQNFIAGGLVALSSNPALLPLDNACNRATVYTNISNALGANGTTNSTFNSNSQAFNCSVTLWGLTVNKNSQNPLQRYMESYKTNVTGSSITTYAITKPGTINSVKLSLNQRNTGKNKVKITLISPSGRTVTVTDRVVNGNLTFSNKVIGGFAKQKARGTWTLKVSGAKGSRVFSHLDIQTK